MDVTVDTSQYISKEEYKAFIRILFNEFLDWEEKQKKQEAEG